MGFSTPGVYTVEDLFDLPLSDLNSAGLKLKEELDNTESLLSSDNAENPISRLQFEIIKDVIKYKEKLAKAKLDAAKKAEHKQKLERALEHVENKELRSKSADELRKELEQM